jgi:type 1 fimbria pilin
MTRPMVFVLAFSLVAAAAAQGKRTFTGVITDSECTTADHSHMRMGPTDAECVTACIDEHGASYVLYDGKNVYALSDQKAPEKFAAKKVTITGTLDAKGKTIRVDSIAAAK